MHGTRPERLDEKLTSETGLENRPVRGARRQLDEKQRGPNLSELHHHVGKHVQESHHGVPEAAVRQALLVPGAGALGGWRWEAEDCVSSRRGVGCGTSPPCPSRQALPGCTR